MRTARLALLITVVAAAGACSGGEEPDTPSDVLADYAEAVRMKDHDRVEQLLSTRFKRRLELADAGIQDFTSSIDSSVQGVGHHVVFSKQLGENVAVVALEQTTRPGAFAQPLVREDDAWRVEPFGLDLVFGSSASAGALRESPKEIGFGVNAPAKLKGRVSARLWLSGRQLSLSRAADGSVDPTFVARPPRLESGSHTVVAYAEADDRRAAIAWTFTISE